MTADPTKRRATATAHARALRADDTEPEYRFWGELRNRRLNGYKFVRQAPLGSYIVDFLCREKLLVVELDGGQHSESAHDARRDRWLNAQGYSVLRFWNHEVLQERRTVLDTLLAVLEGHIDAPSPGLRFAPATLSPLGRGGRQSRPAKLTVEDRLRIKTGRPPLPSGERVAGAKRRPGEGASQLAASLDERPREAPFEPRVDAFNAQTPGHIAQPRFVRRVAKREHAE